MSLFYFSRRAGLTNAVRSAFRLQDAVVIVAERLAKATVIGTRTQKPFAPEVLVEREDGSMDWLAEHAVRAAGLTVIQGGKSATDIATLNTALAAELGIAVPK